MAVINVYEQYFRADHTAGGVKRRAALVMLIATSEDGNIRYEAAVTFFPHRDPEDFGVSYDDYFSCVLFEGKGRRSKKRDRAFTDSLQQTIDALTEASGAKVFWDQPLREPRFG